MEAVRTSAETCSVVPVVVVELCALNAEVLRPWSDNTMWTANIDFLLGILGSSDDHATHDLCIAVNDVFCERKFNACENIVCSLEVVELDSTHTLCNRSISTILV